MSHVLVIGSGGREHTIAWKLSQSPKVGKVTVAPGNAATQNQFSQSTKIIKPPCDYPGLTDYSDLSGWCLANQISLVVVGPEDPLANGIVDRLTRDGIPCFGPNKKAALIEASKKFAKSFMTDFKIPTADWSAFTDAQEAKEYILRRPLRRCVVKADGLAAGKGVVVAQSEEAAFQAVDDIMVESKYGSSCGDTIIVEEMLDGYEVSCLCFTDGTSVKFMPLSQDHKKLLDRDKGPNTGGMGAYAPCSLVDSGTEAEIHYIMKKTVLAMRTAGHPFTGVLYGGFMVTADGPMVLEFNCRFGDPETQVVLSLLNSDLYDIMMSCCTGTLDAQEVSFNTSQSAVGVVLASGGYPNKYNKGLPITGIDLLPPGIKVFHAGTAFNKKGELTTSGGRVLAVVSVGNSLEEAAAEAQRAAAAIQFEGVFFRRDIAHAALTSGSSKGMTYLDAGVDIAAGDKLVSCIKPLCKSTQVPGCVGSLGLFGSVFDLKLAEFKDPLLVSGTDGVGTKLLVALECGNHSTVGEDLVAMCVNDILCHGARPLFFLDYFATSKLDVSQAKEVIAGIASGCKKAGCALVGGETAEMPGVYPSGKYDLAGFAVGAVDRQMYLPRVSDVHVGDIVIGLPSSGLHSNGFSLVRKILSGSKFKYSDLCPFDESKTIGELLLTPTRIYVEPVLKTLASGQVKAVSHITGGGLVENIPRVLPPGVKVQLDATLWKIPEVFGWLQSLGKVPDIEMCRTFNCGLGLVLITGSDQSKAAALCAETGGQVVGKVMHRVEGEGQVQIDNLRAGLHGHPTYDGIQKKVAVLISGSGTNLQALIDSCAQPGSNARIVMVISNKDGVKGLERAALAGIPTKVISHKGHATRESFDDLITEELEMVGTEIVCLAGFMRILSGRFVNRWAGRLLNVHPSLLPLFKGANAHEQALAAGVKVSGCTVHHVVEEIDSGEILEQETIPVLPNDTVESLQERVKTAEHRAFPRALHNLAKQLIYREKCGGHCD